MDNFKCEIWIYKPWHPISNYNVTFDDAETGPITDDSLYNQVMYQYRWEKARLKDFRRIIFFGNFTYREKICKAFRNVQAEIIDGYTGETVRDLKEEQFPIVFSYDTVENYDFEEDPSEETFEELPDGYEDILHPEGEGDYDSDRDFLI